ncbi:MAG: hypothetical protein COZ20_07755 [Gallionellales bacterium CG_4_10_14_3_um_filter_54_96]|nr:MAG: hypothetical protein COW45_00905 [Gallionellales bacterium CG17_big_fil_post_rev_8_21_14_2_50_54_146]PIX04500.1 MAG: hypothetical protein COZ77_06195 [Gallionellales bacterium CG_4_8_14_3_um_filter_54_18]PIY03649.1 MAG: hypothetical protein COZ20_07755 [Gallionellales bacterium CG_4_10_14_3_um_filter_54_96]
MGRGGLSAKKPSRRLLGLLATKGGNQATASGETGYRREVLEAMLSPAIENETEVAYVRTTYLEERHLIMRQWADYLDAVKVGRG